MQQQQQLKVGLIRSDSSGIKGTYANAKCHAQACTPLIKALEAQVHAFGFKSWKQGHNVHVFETFDGRRFDIVPYADETGYTGLQYRLRESRSKATPIMHITSLDQVNDLITVIKCTARPMPANRAAKFQHERK